MHLVFVKYLGSLFVYRARKWHPTTSGHLRHNWGQIALGMKTWSVLGELGHVGPMLKPSVRDYRARGSNAAPHVISLTWPHGEVDVNKAESEVVQQFVVLICTEEKQKRKAKWVWMRKWLWRHCQHRLPLLQWELEVRTLAPFTQALQPLKVQCVVKIYRILLVEDGTNGI